MTGVRGAGDGDERGRPGRSRGARRGGARPAARPHRHPLHRGVRLADVADRHRAGGTRARGDDPGPPRPGSPARGARPGAATGSSASPSPPWTGCRSPPLSARRSRAPAAGARPPAPARRGPVRATTQLPRLARACRVARRRVRGPAWPRDAREEAGGRRPADGRHRSHGPLPDARGGEGGAGRRPGPRHGLHGRPGRPRGREAARCARRLRRPRHLRGRGEPRPPPGPDAAGRGGARAAVGADRGPRRHGEPPVRRGHGRALGPAAARHRDELRVPDGPARAAGASLPCPPGPPGRRAGRPVPGRVLGRPGDRAAGRGDPRRPRRGARPPRLRRPAARDRGARGGSRAGRPGPRPPRPRDAGGPAGRAARLGRGRRCRGDADPAIHAQPSPHHPEQALRGDGGRRPGRRERPAGDGPDRHGDRLRRRLRPDGPGGDRGRDPGRSSTRPPRSAVHIGSEPWPRRTPRTAGSSRSRRCSPSTAG